MNFDFQTLYRDYTDEALLTIVKNPKGYQDNAVNTASNILKERGWTEESISDFTFEIKEEHQPNLKIKIPDTNLQLGNNKSSKNIVFEIFRILLIIYSIIHVYYFYEIVKAVFTNQALDYYPIIIIKAIIEFAILLYAIIMFLKGSKLGYQLLLISFAFLFIYQLAYNYEIIKYGMDLANENRMMVVSYLIKSISDLVISPAIMIFGLWVLFQKNILEKYGVTKSQFYNFLSIGLIYGIIVIFIQNYNASYEEALMIENSYDEEIE